MDWYFILQTLAIALAMRIGMWYQIWKDKRAEAKKWEHSWSCTQGCGLTISANEPSVLMWLSGNHLEDTHGIEPVYDG